MEHKTVSMIDYMQELEIQLKSQVNMFLTSLQMLIGLAPVFFRKEKFHFLLDGKGDPFFGSEQMIKNEGG